MEQTLLQMLSQQSTGVALAVADVDGRLTMTTPALRTMLGREMADVSWAAFEPLDVRDPGDGHPLELEEMPIIRACHGELVRDQVVSVRRPDRLLIYLRCSAAPLVGEAGSIEGGICLMQDVTAEWTAAAKQAELRDRLVRTVNHELRTPLTKILGHCELLGELADEPDTVLPPHVVRSVRAIERAGRDLASLAQRITDLADLDSATQVDAAPIDLAALVRHEVESARARSDDAVPEILLQAPAELPATVDGHLVGWALKELLDNAVHHSPSTSRVRVTLRSADGHVELTVSDEGHGVPEPDRERILRPFERGETVDPSESSPGLGLAVVSAVVAAHGGSVVFADNQPHGLVVRLTLLRHLD